ncbi:MAG: hypothetical protein WA821_21700 [Anaerolineales bacterium]
MRKRIVQGIGLLFLLWAVSSIFTFLMDKNPSLNFFGLFYVKINDTLVRPSFPATIDVGRWIGILIIVYTGYSLIRLRKSGRFWALFIFSLILIAYFLLLIWGIYVVMQDPNHVTPGNLYLGNNVYGIDNWFPALGFFILLIAPPALGIFFLSSKETKALFEPDLIEMEKTDAP